MATIDAKSVAMLMMRSSLNFMLIPLAPGLRIVIVTALATGLR